MKKTVLRLVLSAIIGGAALCSFTSAATVAQPTASWNPTLTQAKSCAEVESAFKDYFSTNWNGGYFGPLKGGVMMNDASTRSAVAPEGGMGGGGTESSQTNNQKAGVDEPDVIKNDGKYIYYADSSYYSDGMQRPVVRIVAANSQGKEAATISLPLTMSNVQIFVSNGKLVVIGSKYNNMISYDTSVIDHSQKISVLIYDVSNATTPKLQSAYEYDGYLSQSRFIDGKLVLVSSQYITWGSIYAKRNAMLTENSVKSISSGDFTFAASELLPRWVSMQPTTITYKNGTVKNSTATKVTQADCTNMFYRKPDQNAGNNMRGQSLTSIMTFDITKPTIAPAIKTILSNSSQVHVTKNNLYLTAPSYVYGPMRCPINARCLMPMWSQGSYTTIDQFSLANLTYNYSTAVKGTTYNQYSMDDTNGIFRIVTSDQSSSKNVTNVYTINSQGNIAGKLENIAPNEQFQGVRFIGSYLYLVTYRQIDPLFVIDVADVTKPTIVGQLKMPGYSTYLHPYGAMQGKVQYLIGLGFDTSIDSYGNEVQNGIKLDLYKVDFNSKDAKGNIAVSQVWSQKLGAGNGTQTEALYNPRMFMFNDTTKELLLPIVFAKTEKTQQCNIIYSLTGAEVRKDCYPTETPVTTFAGIKGWKIGIDKLTETVSVDYKDILKDSFAYGSSTTTAGLINPWSFTSLMPRVGYIGDTYYFISTQFAHLFQKNNLSGVRVNFPRSVAAVPPMVEPASPVLKPQG